MSCLVCHEDFVASGFGGKLLIAIFCLLPLFLIVRTVFLIVLLVLFVSLSSFGVELRF